MLLSHSAYKGKTDSAPKRQHTNFRCRGITQTKEHKGNNVPLHAIKTQQYSPTSRPLWSRASKIFSLGCWVGSQPVLTFWVRTNLPQLTIKHVPLNPQHNHYTNTVLILMTTATSNNSHQSVTMGTCFTAWPLSVKCHLTSCNNYGNTQTHHFYQYV
jgi:hypothetical protein